jgi:Domain of unknown function (DUF4440)
MKRAILVALVVVSTGLGLAAGSENDKDVLQFEREACQAFLDGTPAALERVLTDDFTLTLSNGAVSGRLDEINDLRSGKVRYEVFENYDMTARLYGDNTAVVIGKTHVIGTSEGKPFERVFQFTDTVVKRDGRWQVAASHVSRLEK